MLLYNSSVFQKSFSNAYMEHPLNNDIKNFFSPENMIDNLGIKTMYTSSNSFEMFFESSDISKVCLLASVKFQLPFKYKTDIFSPKIKAYELNENVHKKYEINNYSDSLLILKENNSKSPLLLKSIAKKEQSILARQEKYEKMSSMDRDFKQKIVSIDFEFNPGLQVKRHINSITEFGLSIQENEKITNHHYLIEDNETVKEKQFLFNFGNTVVIPRAKAIEILTSHIQDAKYLLFHSHSEDYGILKTNNVKMREDMEILDTQYFYRKTLQGEHDESSISLKNLLINLDIKGDNFHNSGNDAVYTLQGFNKIHTLYIDSLNKDDSELSRLKEKTLTITKQQVSINPENNSLTIEESLEPSKNSRIYNLKNVQDSFSNLYIELPNQKQINDYFASENIFINIAGMPIYTTESESSILLDRRGLLKLCSKAADFFNLPFRYKNEELKPGITYSHINEELHTKHIIKNQDDINSIANKFSSSFENNDVIKEKRKIKLSM